MKNKSVEIILFALLIIVSVAFAYYYGTQQGKLTFSPTPQANTASEESKEIDQAPSPTPSPTTPTATPESNVPSGWKTYVNQEYGFEISYPPSYKALTDNENLYGWPNGIVLFYGGGQSYDLVVQHWNSPSEYENKYKNQTNVTVKKIGDTYITLLNTNFETEVDEIIETFKNI